MVRHECKHLLALVMEWIGPLDWTEVKRRSERRTGRMEWLQRRIYRYKQGTLAPDPDDPKPIEPEIVFPAEVANALNIYRHEEIERFSKSGNPWRDTEWSSGKARKIADGLIDQKKQSAFYVNVNG